MAAMPSRQIDTIIGALYDGFSRAGGRACRWERLRLLFLPGARIYRADVSQGGCSQSGVGPIGDVIATVRDFFEEHCFCAREISRQTERSGNFAKVLSTYEVRYRPEDSEPFRRGKNRIQLFYDGQRWWITSMLLCDCQCGKLLSGDQPARVQIPDRSWNHQSRNDQLQRASNGA